MPVSSNWTNYKTVYEVAMMYSRDKSVRTATDSGTQLIDIWLFVLPFAAQSISG